MTKQQTRQIIHADSGRILVQNARWCDSFSSRMRGFTFKRMLDAGEGLVLVDKSESRINAAITMLFVNFDLGVLWINSSGEVVDKKLARSWHFSYSPKVPARYVVESDPEILKSVKIGDRIEFQTIPQEPKS